MAKFREIIRKVIGKHTDTGNIETYEFGKLLYESCAETWIEALNWLLQYYLDHEEKHEWDTIGCNVFHLIKDELKEMNETLEYIKKTDVAATVGDET